LCVPTNHEKNYIHTYFGFSLCRPSGVRGKGRWYTSSVIGTFFVCGVGGITGGARYYGHNYLCIAVQTQRLNTNYQNPRHDGKRINFTLYRNKNSMIKKLDDKKNSKKTRCQNFEKKTRIKTRWRFWLRIKF
jgi:hypothetical protein